MNQSQNASARDVALEDMSKFHQHKQQSKTEKTWKRLDVHGIGCSFCETAHDLLVYTGPVNI